MEVIAASRRQHAVLTFLLNLPNINLFVRNWRNETVYDIAAEKADLSMCTQIESHERSLFGTLYTGGIFYVECH